MHGLNTNQRVTWLGPIQTNWDGSQGQVASIFDSSPDSPNQLATIMPSDWNTQGDGDTQFYIKRNYTLNTITNCGPFPFMLETYWFRCKTDIDNSKYPNITALLQDDAPSCQLPYISPCTGNTFQKLMTIIKCKKRIINPGKSTTITTKGIIRSRPITFDVQGDVGIRYRKGGTVMFSRIMGLPSIFMPPGTGPTFGSCLTPYQWNGITKQYLSYYTMNDITPTTTATTDIQSALPSDNVFFAPIPCNMMQANTATLTAWYSQPNTVRTVAFTP